MELRPPDIAELVDLVQEDAPLLSPHSLDGAGDVLLEQLARALLGLTLDEAGYALRRALSADQRIILQARSEEAGRTGGPWPYPEQRVPLSIDRGLTGLAQRYI